MPERVLVEFADDGRVVLVNDRPGGHTNIAFDVDTGTHVFSLDGAADFTPGSQELLIQGTSFDKPKVVRFEKIAAAGDDAG